MRTRHPIVNCLLDSGWPGILLLSWPILLLFVSRERDMEAYSNLDEAAYAQIAFLAVCGLYLLFDQQLYWMDNLKIFFRRPILWATVYGFICLLSSFWSSHWQLTLYRSVESMIMLLLLGRLVQHMDLNFEKLLDWTILWAIVMMIFKGGTSILFNTDKSNIFMMLRGFSNLTLGPVIIPILFLSRRRIITVCLLILGLLSLSHKFYLGLGAGFIAMALFCPEERTMRNVGVFVIFGITLLLSAFGTTKLISYASFTKTEEDILSGSGRTYLYSEYYHKIKMSPYLGYGYVEGEHVEVPELGFIAPSAHNSILSGLMTGGIPGGIMVFAFFWDLIGLSHRRIIHPRVRSSLFGGAIMTLIVSLLGPGFGSRVNGGWISTIILGMLVIIATYRGSEYSNPNHTQSIRYLQRGRVRSRCAGTATARSRS
ncbi:MAG: O-antigen ligase family protein [Sedimentisphaerales bacterium]|nr:O-antigen ligase family protein [Sedimentisphaerales bacterium]